MYFISAPRLGDNTAIKQNPKFCLVASGTPNLFSGKEGLSLHPEEGRSDVSPSIALGTEYLVCFFPRCAPLSVLVPFAIA